ncbi:E3 ubiquitin-protein ligase UPL5 [Nicotiana tabacum]|uniref:E3 ubiquitin-protein ligase UPL5 n=1 Tax=Nicotiana tabacum TaxID=4097 RepID=UPI003F4F3594
MTYHTQFKRQFDDYAAEAGAALPPAARVRKDEALPSSSPPSTRLQFFVRLFSGVNKTLVLQADSTDTVLSVHRKIESITGIRTMTKSFGVPGIDQRLIYKGKQLQLEQTLAVCDVQQDASLQLVGRMRSTRHPLTWKLMSELIALISNSTEGRLIKKMLSKILTMTPKDETKSEEYLRIFIYSSVPAHLVKLYVSPSNSEFNNKDTADECIREFIKLCKKLLSDSIYAQCVHIVLEFCKLLRGAAGVDDALYGFCRSSLADIMDWYDADAMDVLPLQDSFPLVRELAARLSRTLELSMGSAEFVGLSCSDVHEFIEFMHPVRSALLCQKAFDCPFTFPLTEKGNSEAGSKRFVMHNYKEKIEGLHHIFCDLLDKLELCLEKLETRLGLKEKEKDEPNVLCWSQYLVILEALHRISKMYKGLEEGFWKRMRQRRVPLCFLIVKLSKRSRDYQWILENKEIVNFEIRRDFAMMMLREGSGKNEELYEMLIDRSHLLEESFEYIRHAGPRVLGRNLFLKFKNEEATGPGVVREWFYLVIQAIFNPQNALFVSCPKDCRRFFPNPASKVDPLHLEYFVFAGRMIALALLHKIQISIVFDRVFFLLLAGASDVGLFYFKLAGKNISLEDIKDADPYLYSSCKKILEMDPEMVDQDALGLTFVCEIEELGSRKVVELCPNGQDTVVNSENRNKYVNLLIQHRFVTSIAPQVTHFARGFADVITHPWLRRSFFRILDPEDLDSILHGSKSDISVEDWRAHTNYKGYKESDPQISWFWKIVSGMSAEQRKVLLFFWTSIKSLPVEGFGGLASKLYIYKTTDSYDCLPSSHTCFYQLCFPPYPSKDVMQKRLHIITQDHVGCSFGTM